VERTIRVVAEREVMPRFGRLAVTDIAEKAPGDLVTVADRDAEEALAEQLGALLPGSTVVGEEAVNMDRRVLGALAGPAPVWIIDPIDGTHNFVAENPRFTMLVALAHRGELLASWTYAPALGLMATAARGAGAFVDGERLRVRPARRGLRHMDICVPQPHWWRPDERLWFNRLSATGVALSFFDMTGLEYIELAAGRQSAMVITWDFPWDHAAGLLLHAEAGGIALDRAGVPFRLGGGTHLPLVIAPDAAAVAEIHTALGS
jgi:fructose-1,6-bisphosphatase/inositol monophosphatase family enzyme